jgi:hypothetical protein
MSSFSLASYLLRIRDVENRKWLQLDSFTTDQDLFDRMSEYLEGLTSPSLDTVNKKLIKLRPPLRKRARVLAGIVETGEWGYTSQLQDVTSEKITYKRKVAESENFPFYFLIAIPESSDKGIVILQRFGNRGIRTQFLSDFQDQFQSTFGNLRVSINPLAPGSLIDQYLSRQGRVTMIRLIQFQPPDDIADLFGSKAKAAKEVYTEYVIRAKAHKRIPIFDRIHDVLEGRRKASHLVEIAGFDPKIIKIGVSFQGRQRTLDIENVGRIRAWYDISDDVKVGPDGHPQFKSIDKLARELLSELKQGAGIK